jgi:polysaccharide deacetylase 2 family uncharacterized protein YibQ
MKALAITASIVFAVLALGIGWLALFPGPDAGEPVAILTLQPAARQGTSAGPSPGEVSTPSAPEGEVVQVPPGVIISLPPSERQQNQPQGQPIQPQPQAFEPPPQGPTPEVHAGLEGARPQVATLSGPGPAEGAPNMPSADALMQAVAAGEVPGADARADASMETGSVPLPDVRVAELVEDSEYGPLPKVAADGRRPLEAYARPSRYAAKAIIGGPALVAVLVSSMGGSDSVMEEALKSLPSPVSVAYSAYGRNLQEWVAKARRMGHEVILQVPLEPLNYPTADPGPHTLLTTLPPEENMKRLQWLMSRFTGYVGVTNLMGAKFEASQEAFLPVLEEIKSRGLLYLDDGTVQQSTAGQIASTLKLDYAVANVQIGDAPSPGDVAKALARLESLAKERGCAIGVAAARPATVKEIAQWAGKLESKGIVLVPVSAAVRSQRQS